MDKCLSWTNGHFNTGHHISRKPQWGCLQGTDGQFKFDYNKKICTGVCEGQVIVCIGGGATTEESPYGQVATTANMAKWPQQEGNYNARKSTKDCGQ